MRWGELAFAPGLRVAVLAVLGLSSGSCGGRLRGPEAFRREGRRTCLVLSVGAHHGVAHLGAIEALKTARVPITCVVGASMGAIVGAMYAVDPAGDTTARFHRFYRVYERAARAEAHDNGFVGAILGSLLGAATGGLGALLLGGAGGAAVGALNTRRVDHGRFVRALDETLEHARIENLRVPFLAVQQRRVGQSFDVVAPTAGSLSEAAGASAAHPLLFGDLNVRTMQVLDPGLDQLSRVPVSLACERFPGARLIAVNVTGGPLLRTEGQHCEVLHVRVPPMEVDPNEALQPGPTFDRLVGAGRRAMREALAGYVEP